MMTDKLGTTAGDTVEQTSMSLYGGCAVLMVAVLMADPAVPLGV